VTGLGQTTQPTVSKHWRK